MTQRLSQRAGALYRHKVGEILHYRALVLIVEEVIRGSQCHKVFACFAQRHLGKAHVQMRRMVWSNDKVGMDWNIRLPLVACLQEPVIEEPLQHVTGHVSRDSDKRRHIDLISIRRCSSERDLVPVRAAVAERRLTTLISSLTSCTSLNRSGSEIAPPAFSIAVANSTNIRLSNPRSASRDVHAKSPRAGRLLTVGDRHQSSTCLGVGCSLSPVKALPAFWLCSSASIIARLRDASLCAWRFVATRCP